MSTKHTATLPDGTIATRTSANRVYPFVIAVGPLPVEAVRERILKEIALHEQINEKHLATAEYLERGGELVVVHDASFGVDRDYIHATGLPFNGASGEYVADRGIGQIARDGGYGYLDLDIARTSVAREQRKNLADGIQRVTRLRAELDNVELGTWGAAAWSSRSELAAKVAESTRAKDPRREVRVLDTDRVSA